MEILLATGNRHKVEEIGEILAGIDVTIKNLDDLEGKFPPPVEDGATYEENSSKKAIYYHRLTGLPTLADDSGLEIDAFGGEPGIYSARYIDPEISFDRRNDIVLERMKGVAREDRGARFCCCSVLVVSDGEIYSEYGYLEGEIAFEKKGKNGFGYDPIFWLPDRGRHLAEVEPEEKNRISHRAAALKKMKKNILRLV